MLQYIAFAFIALVSAFLFGLLIYGFIQGVKEGPHSPEYYTGSLLPELPENRIHHVDAFGTWDGYSVPGDKEGEWKHFDSFGICQGTSRNMADGTVAHYDPFGIQVGSSKKGW